MFVTKGIFGLGKKIVSFLFSTEVLFSWKTAKLDCFVLAVLQNHAGWVCCTLSRTYQTGVSISGSVSFGV